MANERMSVTKKVHTQTKARCTGEMRDELLGTVGRSDRTADVTSARAAARLVNHNSVKRLNKTFPVLS